MGSMWLWCGLLPGKSRPKITLLAHEGFRFPAALRRAVLAAMNAQVDFDGGVGAAELAAGACVCGGCERDCAAAQGASSIWLAATDKRSITSRARRRMPGGGLPAPGRRARRRRLLPRSAFPSSRTSGPPICWRAARARRSFLCSIMFCLPIPGAGVFCRILEALRI